jgi:hypothetical protein
MTKRERQGAEYAAELRDDLAKAAVLEDVVRDHEAKIDRMERLLIDCLHAFNRHEDGVAYDMICNYTQDQGLVP